MGIVQGFLARLLPALLMAAGVTLVAAGLLSYTAPPVIGEDAQQTSPPVIGVGPSPTRTPTPTRTPRTTPTVAPASDEPTPSPTPEPAAVVTRIRVPALRIDLAVVSSELDPPGNLSPGYPLCDVAQYATWYLQPSQEGTTYIFGHARNGMFGPLLTESQRSNGARMIGQLVQVWTAELRVYTYEIFQVKRHSTDFAIADSVEPGERRLVLQTSEGPRGTVPKLQVAARLLTEAPAPRADSLPKANWTICP